MATPAETLARAQASLAKAIATPLYAERIEALYDAIEHIRATVKLIKEQEAKCH